MAIERTFSILKPDATARNLTGAINAVIEKAGLRIIAQKRIRMSQSRGRDLLRRASRAAVLRRTRRLHDLRRRWWCRCWKARTRSRSTARSWARPTRPRPPTGTIRKLFAKSIGENSVHGSDAAETAAKEIAQFFSGNEIVG